MHGTTIVLLDASVKGLVLLALAAGVTWRGRRQSAAMRHMVWLLAVTGTLLLPVLSLALPGWRVLPAVVTPTPMEASTPAGMMHEDAAPVPMGMRGDGPVGITAPAPQGHDRTPASGDHAATSATPPVAPAMPDPSATSTQTWWQPLANTLPWVWAAGVVVALAPLVMGTLSLAHLRRVSQVIEGGSWRSLLRQSRAELGLRRRVTLLQSPRRAMPMTWGILSSKILLPDDGLTWPPARRRAVLLHELAHVKRHDCLTQVVAQIACAVFWFNPLMWYAAHRMRVERERACDDLVLSRGTRSSEYAEHLFEIAAGTQAGRLAALAAVPMARRSQLERRLQAVLEAGRNRATLTRLGVAMTLAAALLIVVPMAMLQAGDAPAEATTVDAPPDEPAPIEVRGQVRRPGAYTLSDTDEPLTLRQAIWSAGGVTDQTPVERLQVRVWRSAEDESHAFALRLADVLNGRAGERPLKPGEVVEVIALAEPEPEPKPEAAPDAEPQTYSFRKLSYDLRAEPMRIMPRTLDEAQPAPADAVVFGWPIRWWSSHWSSSRNTANAAMTMTADHPRFTVTEAGRRKVWVKYFDVPVDPERYPVLVMTYRAARTDTSPDASGYVLYLDDTSGPDYGGLLPVLHRDLIADGAVHTLTCDLRTMQPIGDLIGLAVGVQAAGELDEPAVFDLIDLRFESTEATREPVEQAAQAWELRVVDEQGTPVEGALVTLDAERANWARAARTDAEGVARVTPHATADGRHMVRVEHEGMLPVEVRNLSPDKTAAQVTLVPASPYRGRVVDESGEPLAGAVVRLRANPRLPVSHDWWTRRDAEAITDADGRWESAPLAQDSAGVSAAVAHPLYGEGPRDTMEHHPPIDALLSGEATLSAAPELVPVEIQVMDEAGQPVTQAVDVQVGPAHRQPSVDGARVTAYLPPTGGQVMLRSEGYAPTLVTVPRLDGDETRSMSVRLERGREVTVELLDDQGQPLTDAQVRTIRWHDFALPGEWRDVDAAGGFVQRLWGEGVLTFEVRKPGYVGRTTLQVPIRGEVQRITVPRDPAPQPHEDGDERRPGYDPERIFRRIS